LLRSPRNPVVSQPIDGGVFDEVEERISGLLEKVRDGRLEPDPSDRQTCVTCDYRRLCRIGK
jgi:CRISPR/Cas system-associated exonuclease Cas4 (RecB family)